MGLRFRYIILHWEREPRENEMERMGLVRKNKGWNPGTGSTGGVAYGVSATQFPAAMIWPRRLAPARDD